MTPATRLPNLLLLLSTILFVAATAKADTDSQAAGGQLVIVSESNCPSAEAVREALAGLRPGEEWPALSVTIRATLPMVEVEIGPQKTAPRQLIIGPDCAERATAVALVISTWTGDLPIEAAGTPVLRPATSASPLAKEPETVIAKSDSRKSEIGVGLLATTVGGIAPGGRLEFAQMKRGNGFGWQTDMTIPAARHVNVGGGSTRWMRLSAGIALDARWATGRFFLDGQLGGVAALTYAWGQGYVANQSDRSPTWGLDAAIRAGLPWGRSRLWLDLRAVRWLREQTVQIDPATTGIASTVSLPSWDAQGSIGISYIFQ